MHTTDLVDRLVAAAESAIRNEAATLAHKPNELSGFVLDIEIRNSGAVLDATAHVSRKYVFRPDAATRLQPALEAKAS